MDTIPLGDHIVHLTYGPIVRGQRPQHRDDGVRVIRQGDFALTGILPTPALKVTSHGAFDPDRSRVLPGDLLMPRSGSGALGENRLAVRVVEEPANVGCFVDVVRLAGVNPFYVWLYLKTREGWGQIRSLINGVGTPNINFGEIRSLRIPQIAAAQQQIVEQRYRTEVLPLHQRRARCPAEAQMADCRFRQLIAALERCLAGDHAALRACG